MTKAKPTSAAAPVSLALAEKPTLKTISRISGLAVPTVSRALNDAPDIGADTKKLVRKIADEIGYVPNRAGVRLRTGRTNVISLVMSTEHDMTPDDYRRRWDLGPDYPLVAPAYAETRRDLAKKIGLGRKPGQRRGRKKKAG